MPIGDVINPRYSDRIGQSWNIISYVQKFSVLLYQAVDPRGIVLTCSGRNWIGALNIVELFNYIETNISSVSLLYRVAH